MQGAKVGQRVLPAVIRNDRPRPIELVCPAVQPVEKGRDDPLLQWPLETNGFVHGYPRHHARVVSVPLNGGGQLVQKSLFRQLAMLVKVGHLGPDQEAKPIGPVQPARVLRLLVLARPIKAKGFREFDVSAEVVVGSRGVPTAGVVALVEHQPLDIRLAVEQHAAVTCPDGSKPAIALDDIDVTTLRIYEPNR